MSYGEASLCELVGAYRELLSESEELLGATIKYLAAPNFTVVRDRLGGVTKVAKNAEPVEIVGASVSFNPTEQLLKRIGIQEQVECAIVISADKLPVDFDEAGCRFIISTSFQKTQEYRVKTVKGIGQVKNTYMHYAIGLVSK